MVDARERLSDAVNSPAWQAWQCVEKKVLGQPEYVSVVQDVPPVPPELPPELPPLLPPLEQVPPAAGTQFMPTVLPAPSPIA